MKTFDGIPPHLYTQLPMKTQAKWKHMKGFPSADSSSSPHLSMVSRLLENINKQYLSRTRGEAGMDRLNRRLGELQTLKDQSQTLAVLQQERLAKLNAPRFHEALLTGSLPYKVTSADAMKMNRKVRECARSLHSTLSRGWHVDVI